MITALKIRLGAQASCLHDFIYCGQDGRAPGCIFIIVCERALIVSAPKMAWERRHPCLHAFIYCGQDGHAPGYILMIVCELRS